MFSKSLLGTVLESVGVEHVFGVPGTQNTPLFEALRHSDIRIVTATSELGAGFMANGYYRASGRPGIVLAIPGPGFTLALTSVAEARADSAALVLLTSRPATTPGNAFQLQAFDQTAIASPLVKKIVDVDRPEHVSTALRGAIRSAQSGEPGPVLVQLGPRAVQAAKESANPMPADPFTPPEAEPADVRYTTRILAEAKRPVLLFGQGAAGSPDAVRRIAEALPAPVLTTPSGRGCLPENHELALGFDVLRGGIAEVNELLDQSDLVVGFGVKFSHNGSAGFNLAIPAERFVHIDASEDVPGANYAAKSAIQADCMTFLPALADGLGARSVTVGSLWTREDIRGWADRIGSALPAGAPEPLIAGMAPRHFFAILGEVLQNDDVLVTDTGLHQILVRRYHDVLAPRTLIMPTDFQSMGFGVPAAIGAALALPKRQILAVVGDGGFAMTGLELLTAARERISLAVAVFNDGYLNQIRINQIRDYGELVGTKIQNPDFAGLAAAIGVRYIDLGSGPPTDALLEILATDAPALIEVPIRDGLSLKKYLAGARIKEQVRQALPDRALGLLKSLITRGRGR